jgi:hypothetical protein
MGWSTWTASRYELEYFGRVVITAASLDVSNGEDHA